MGLSCGGAVVKYLLCFFNFLLFALGGALLAVSIWVAIDNTSFFLLTRITDNNSLQVHNETSVLETGAYILIAAGALIFLLGFLGCCGAAMESRPLLAIYGVFVILVFLLEVTAGVLIAIYKQEVEMHLEDFMKETLRKHYTHHREANSISVTWDAMMIQMQCCGVNNYTDFDLAPRWKDNESDSDVVPRACCMLQRGSLEVQDGVRVEGSGVATYSLLDESCLYNPTENNSYHLVGCLRRIQSTVFYYLLPSLSAAIALGAIQLIIITLSFYLCRAISISSKDKLYFLSTPVISYQTPSLDQECITTLTEYNADDDDSQLISMQSGGTNGSLNMQHQLYKPRHNLLQYQLVPTGNNLHHHNHRRRARSDEPYYITPANAITVAPTPVSNTLSTPIAPSLDSLPQNNENCPKATRSPLNNGKKNGKSPNVSHKNLNSSYSEVAFPLTYWDDSFSNDDSSKKTVLHANFDASHYENAKPIIPNS